MEAKYSREFEGEADRFAIQYFAQKNISTKYFVAILLRLDQTRNVEKRATGFLDTHPASSERSALLEE
jgi:predicted Zn-dependent protease